MGIIGGIFVALFIYALEVISISMGGIIIVKFIIALVVVVFLGMKRVFGLTLSLLHTISSGSSFGGSTYVVVLIFGMYGYTFGKEGECERGHLKDSAHSGSRSNAAAKSEGGCQDMKPSADAVVAQARDTFHRPPPHYLGYCG